MKKIMLLCHLLFSTHLFAGEFPIIPASEAETFDHIYNGSDLMDAYRAYQKKENRDGGQIYEAGFYTGYVTGVVEMTRGLFFCPPPKVTIGQYAGITGKYLEANPARLHLAGHRLVIESLIAQYPCKKGK